jgi:hypothetical protein
MKKSIKRYIPEKVYEKIQTLNFKNKEHLYIICDMIYRVSIFRNEDKDYSNQFIDIPKYYFEDIISDKNNLSIAFKFLLDNNILECDNIYSKNSGKALGYRFNIDLISVLTTIEINKITLTKRIINNRNERNNAVNEKLHNYRDYYLQNFNINYNESIDFLNNWFYNSISNINTLLCSRFFKNEKEENEFYHKEWTKLVNKNNHIFMSLNCINDGELYFKKNKTNGRVDTNLTSLKSDYKKFIKIPKNLYQLDIVNSQPFILYLYITNNFNTLLCSRFFKNENEIQELEKYGKWTSSGNFYENFTREYYNKRGKLLSRKDIKNIMFCIFYSKNGSYTREKKIFKSIFPTILKFIEKQKENKHNEFAIKLQKLESEICIDIICQKLNEKNIKYYTIHDAWLVNEEYIEETEKIINEEFIKKYNNKPKLKIEKIN